MYYLDILCLEGWDTLTNILNLPLTDVFIYGARCEKYARQKSTEPRI